MDLVAKESRSGAVAAHHLPELEVEGSNDCPFRERPVVHYLFRARPTLISCPTCGRCQVANVDEIAREVDASIRHLNTPAKVAVMGCAVNGPGEARDADIGVACGRGQAILFVKGEKAKTVPAGRIVEELLERLPHIIVDSPPREPTRWLCWAHPSCECALDSPDKTCFDFKKRETYRPRGGCPHRKVQVSDG